MRALFAPLQLRLNGLLKGRPARNRPPRLIEGLL